MASDGSADSDVEMIGDEEVDRTDAELRLDELYTRFSVRRTCLQVRSSLSFYFSLFSALSLSRPLERDKKKSPFPTFPTPFLSFLFPPLFPPIPSLLPPRPASSSPECHFLRPVCSSTDCPTKSAAAWP